MPISSKVKSPIASGRAERAQMDGDATALAGADPSGLYKRFPPFSGNIHLPAESRRSAAASLALYGACKPAALCCVRIVWLCLRLLGPRIVPGRAVAWTPPMERVLWDALLTRWCTDLGIFDQIGIYERAQRARSGFVCLLLSQGQPIACVKVAATGSRALHTEHDALAAIQCFRPRHFSVPAVLGFGECGGWEYLATAPLDSPLHRPPMAPPLTAVIAEVQSGLDALPRPRNVPDHWRPMHGDFAPWNFRKCRTGLVLYDWEEMSWAPEHADEVYYRATSSAVYGHPAEPLGAPEAIRFWQQRLNRSDSKERRDAELAGKLMRCLERMAAAC